MSVLDWSGEGFDLSLNAAAPLAPWAEAIQQRGRFEPKAQGPDAFDCWGLAAFVQTLLGRSVRSYAECYAEADFGKLGALDRLIRAEAETWTRGNGDVGDVLALARGGALTHVAVLCGAGRVLHAMSTAGVVIEPVVGKARVTRVAGLRVVGCAVPA